MARSSARPHSSFNPYLPLPSLPRRIRGDRDPASPHRGSLLFLLPLRELAAEHGGLRLLAADAAPPAPRPRQPRRQPRRVRRPSEAVPSFPRSLAGSPRRSSPCGAPRRLPRGFRRRRARSAPRRASCGCRSASSWLWRAALTVEAGRRAAGRAAAPRAARGPAASAEVGPRGWESSADCCCAETPTPPLCARSRGSRARRCPCCRL